jgi:hypothetical protein
MRAVTYRSHQKEEKAARGQLAALETNKDKIIFLVTLLLQQETWDINTHFINNLCLLALWTLTFQLCCSMKLN